jgi:myo-inositol-1(or 4)-monophosphatase
MKEITELLRQTIQEAGEVLREGFMSSDGSYERKDALELVTKWDMQSEQIIRERILGVFPSHAIYGEEGGGVLTDEGWLWIVDPLDGTTNFIHRHPYFCVSIGCYKDGMPVAGGVYAPISNELFLAERGGGAYKNGVKMRVSAVSELNLALFVTGYPYKREGKIERAKTLLTNALTSVQCIRRMGSAALDLCYTANGVFDIYIEFDLRPWDVAAGALILKEAGGMISLCSGEDFRLDRGEVFASNGVLHSLAIANLLMGVS